MKRWQAGISMSVARWPKRPARPRAKARAGRLPAAPQAAAPLDQPVVQSAELWLDVRAVGAMVGAAGGATAGFLRGLFRRSPPSNAYKQFVQRCLKERGYDPVGWE